MIRDDDLMTHSWYVRLKKETKQLINAIIIKSIWCSAISYNSSNKCQTGTNKPACVQNLLKKEKKKISQTFLLK